MMVLDDTEIGVMPKLKDTAPSLRSNSHGNLAKVMAITESREGKFRVHRNDEKKSEIQGYSFFDPKTVGVMDVVDSHAKNIVNDMRIRRLTPRECERLQGFPDDWTRWALDEQGRKVEISDTQRYRMMGNAVTVNVVEFIARRLPA